MSRSAFIRGRDPRVQSKTSKKKNHDKRYSPDNNPDNSAFTMHIHIFQYQKPENKDILLQIKILGNLHINCDMPEFTRNFVDPS